MLRLTSGLRLRYTSHGLRGLSVRYGPACLRLTTRLAATGTSSTIPEDRLQHAISRHQLRPRIALHPTRTDLQDLVWTRRHRAYYHRPHDDFPSTGAENLRCQLRVLRHLSIDSISSFVASSSSLANCLSASSQIRCLVDDADYGYSPVLTADLYCAPIYDCPRNLRVCAYLYSRNFLHSKDYPPDLPAPWTLLNSTST